MNEPVDGFEQALTLVPSCTLDADGRESQKARYRALTEAMTRLRREPEAVLVDFDARLDPAVIGEVIAVEHACCPLLRLEFDSVSRRLSVTVADPVMLPALDAIEEAFAGARR